MALGLEVGIQETWLTTGWKPSEMHMSSSARYLQAPAAAFLENPPKLRGWHAALFTRAGLHVPLLENRTTMKTYLTPGPNPHSVGLESGGSGGVSNPLSAIMVGSLKKGGQVRTDGLIGEPSICQRGDDPKLPSKPL